MDEKVKGAADGLEELAEALADIDTASSNKGADLLQRIGGIVDDVEAAASMSVVMSIPQVNNTLHVIDRLVSVLQHPSLGYLC